jgi:regulator of nucleoside diphosphate kinase
MKNEVKISKLDYKKLNSMILNLLDNNETNILELNRLNIEIKRAQLVEPRKVAPEFVTMNSIVQLRFSGNIKLKVIKLVYPKEAKDGHISVLSSLGRAILGYKEGEVVSFKAPEGIQSVTIEKILYQPEANGEDLQ